MKDEVSVTIRAHFVNRKAVRAFSRVLECLEDIAEDFPYREDVQKALKAARYAAKHLAISTDDGHEGWSTCV